MINLLMKDYTVIFILFLVLSVTISYSQDHRILFDFENNFNLNAVTTNNAQLSLDQWDSDTALGIVFSRDSIPYISLEKASGWDLSGFVFVAMDVKNTGTNRVQVFAGLNGRRRANGALILEPGESDTLLIYLGREWDSLPQYIRDYFWPKFKGLPGGFRTGYTPDPSRITSIDIYLVMPSKDKQSVLVDNIRAQAQYKLPTQAELVTFSPFIDQFGQFKHKEWPGKTKSPAELVTQYHIEATELKQKPGPDNWTRYGGWAAGPRFDSTGSFYTYKYNGLWWLVDPDGYLFWSNGIDCINYGCGTLIKTPDKDRSGYFEVLPEKIVGSGGWEKGYYFYTNLRKKYAHLGTDWGDSAIDIAHKRLRSWGINTIGAWSDFSIYLQHPVKTPYVVIIQSIIPHHVNQEVLDSPEWRNLEDSLRVQLGRQKATTGCDPWCIGYFIDNEMSWATVFDSATLAYAVNYYFKACSDAMKDSVPEKLYLGNRKHYFTPDFMSRQELYAAARYCDVISLNRYAFTMRDLPVLDAIDPLLDKPVVIGEFHFGAVDRGLPQGGLRNAKDQKQRARAYRQYVQDALRHPNLVGVHWFQYVDQPYTARDYSDDGENYQIGFVDICDNPYPELIAMCREVNYSLYEDRMNSTAVIDNVEPLLAKNGCPVAIYIIAKKHGVLFRVNTGREGDVSLKVYTILGRDVWQVKEHKLSGGSHDFFWKPDVASGMYIAVVTFEKVKRSRQFCVMKR